MRIFPFIRKKDVQLSPEEQEKAEQMENAVVPDMREEDVSGDVTVDNGSEIVELRERVVVPEKGVLRTDNLVKRYGKRTVR